MSKMDDPKRDAFERAVTAYRKRCLREEMVFTQPEPSEIEREGGTEYIVLRGIDGAFAVYRLGEDGGLFWLEPGDWPDLAR